MRAEANPAGTIWYNCVHKVSAEKLGYYLKSMAKVVGIDTACFSNKSGRATLITRMAFLGVPDEVGRLITGHHTVDGYQRYDRSLELQQQAATLCGANPSLTYEAALREVCEKFREDQFIGKSKNLCPLVDQATRDKLVVVSSSKTSQVRKLFLFYLLVLPAFYVLV
jgi:hypothetical protein